MRHKKACAVFVILRTLVVAVLIRSAVIGQWESVFVCALTLVLLLIPPIVERSLHIDLPTTLEILVFCFVFCAEILGEIECYRVLLCSLPVLGHSAAYGEWVHVCCLWVLPGGCA